MIVKKHMLRIKKHKGKIMPKKPKYTKEMLVDTAVNIIREKGISYITAQSLAKKLNATAPSVFTHFSSVDEIRQAARNKAKEIYNEYVEKGLKMNPPFKGFSLQIVKFAMDEPQLYKLLFHENGKNNTFSEYIENEGHFDEVTRAIQSTFGLEQEKAKSLFSNCMIYIHGISSLIACHVCCYTIEEVSCMFGKVCRWLIIGLSAPENEMTKIIPANNLVIDMNINEYLNK